MNHLARILTLTGYFAAAGAHANTATIIAERELNITRLEEETAAQKKALANIKEQAGGYEKMREEAKALGAGIEKLGAECRGMIAERAKLIAAAREQSLAMRVKAEGVKFDTFTTRSGKTFAEVVFKAALDQGVRLTHKDGTTTVAPADLPATLRQDYGYVLGDAANIADGRKLPDMTAVAIAADGSALDKPKLATKVEVGSDGNPITDSERLMSGMAAEATFKREQAKALRLKAKPGDKLFQQAQQLETEAAQLEGQLGRPQPPRP